MLFIKPIKTQSKNSRKKDVSLAGTFKMGYKWMEGQNDPGTLRYATFSVTSACPADVRFRGSELRFEQRGPTDRRCLGSITHMIYWRDKAKYICLDTAAAWPLTSEQPWVLPAFLGQTICGGRMKPGLVIPMGGQFRHDQAVRPEVAQSWLGLSPPIPIYGTLASLTT